MSRGSRRRPSSAEAKIVKWTAMAVIGLSAACTRPGEPPPAAAAAASRKTPAAAEQASERSTAWPPRTNLSLTDRANWRPILNWPDECESAFQTSHAGDDPGIVFHSLAPQLSIVEVVCAAGSYQPSSTIVRLDERNARLEVSVLRFPVYEAETGVTPAQTETAEVWGEVVIDPAKPIMTVLNLARQTGDCGIWTRYDIANNPPAIVDARARLPCPARARPALRPELGHAPLGWRTIRNKP